MGRNDCGFNFSTLNWKNPHTFQLSQSGHSVGFADKLGWYALTNADTDSYLSTSYTPNTHKVQFAQNSGTFFFGCTSYPLAGVVGISGSNLIAYGSGPLSTTGSLVAGYAMNGTITEVVTSNSNMSQGNYGVHRVDSSNHAVYRGNGLLGTSAVASSTPSSSELYLIGLPTGGAAFPQSRISSGSPISYIGLGNGFSSTELGNIATAIQDVDSGVLYEIVLTTSGNYTVPAGITSLLVECVGGGGAGRGYPAAAQTTTGAGGGGGAYSAKVVSVTPSDVIAYTIGAGGTGDTGAGSAGGDTTWNTSVVVAKGGGVTSTNTTGGPGGLASGGTGDTKFDGGTGGAGSTTLSGWSSGGGGSAGSSLMAGPTGKAAENTASQKRGNFAPLGSGVPGQTVVANDPGYCGTFGAGGSGARRSAAGAPVGGNGGSGYIRLSVFRDLNAYGY